MIWSAKLPLRIGDDDACDALHQDAVLGGDLLGAPDEDASGTVEQLRIDAARDQAHDLILQQLAVTRVVLVPDDQIDGETLQPPIRMRLHYLPNQVDIGRIADLQQHDRQIAGDRVAPQARLAAMVVAQDAALGAQQGIGIEHGAGQAAEELSIGFGRVQLSQHYQTVRPRQIEYAIGQVRVLILVDQRP